MTRNSNPTPTGTTEQSFALAREQYATIGVDADAALDALTHFPISLQCWQGDDVTGFEKSGDISGAGIMATGNYPGRARNAEELRQDLDKALSLAPGKHRVNLHAMYAETAGSRVDRNGLLPSHFAAWVDWARSRNRGLDFNPTFFAHPRAASGFTLSSRDESIRSFWVEHGAACRVIAESFGRKLGTPAVTNFWIPDGYKDLPIDRKGPRELLLKSLDEIFSAPVSADFSRDAVESKLFGIGTESYTVGSHEFYLGYAVRRNKILCLDMGHFHPTESVADKISALLVHLPGILLHVSRGVRWDSDHIVILNEEVEALAQEIVRTGAGDRIFIGLDYFDASINRLAAWIIGIRSVQKALLKALLQPLDRLRAAEIEGDYTLRLALTEEAKSLPFGAVWDRFCRVHDMPGGPSWIDEVRTYEREVLSRRT